MFSTDGATHLWVSYMSSMQLECMINYDWNEWAYYENGGCSHWEIAE